MCGKCRLEGLFLPKLIKKKKSAEITNKPSDNLETEAIQKIQNVIISSENLEINMRTATSQSSEPANEIDTIIKNDDLTPVSTSNLENRINNNNDESNSEVSANIDLSFTTTSEIFTPEIVEQFDWP
jgi:hypothetical protein